MTSNYEKLNINALRAEYDRLDGILLEVIADMAVLKYHIDMLTHDDM